MAWDIRVKSDPSLRATVRCCCARRPHAHHPDVSASFTHKIRLITSLMLPVASSTSSMNFCTVIFLSRTDWRAANTCMIWLVNADCARLMTLPVMRACSHCPRPRAASMHASVGSLNGIVLMLNHVMHPGSGGLSQDEHHRWSAEGGSFEKQFWMSVALTDCLCQHA